MCYLADLATRTRRILNIYTYTQEVILDAYWSYNNKKIFSLKYIRIYFIGKYYTTTECELLVNSYDYKNK